MITIVLWSEASENFHLGTSVAALEHTLVYLPSLKSLNMLDFSDIASMTLKTGKLSLVGSGNLDKCN
jgi:hypothetical protein